MKIGIFGGTFNPVHNGHINLVNRICDEISLDILLVIPTAIPPHKAAPELISGKHRLNMLKLAFEDNKNAVVSDYELRNEGKSYTILTLEHFRSIYPKAEFYLLMGSDMFITLHEWKRYRDIYKLCEIVVVSRSNDDKQNINNYLPYAKSEGAKCRVINIEPYEISSTAIREMIEHKQDFSCYLPQKVVKYISNFKLYCNNGKC